MHLQTFSNVSLFHSDSHKLMSRPKSNIGLRNNQQSNFSVQGGLSIQKAPLDNGDISSHGTRQFYNKTQQDQRTTTQASEVPEGVRDWYLANITKTLEPQNAQKQRKGISVFHSQGTTLKRIVGLTEDKSDMSLITLPQEHTGESFMH